MPLESKWLERLLDRPEFWPFSRSKYGNTNGDPAGPHAPRLRELRKIFLVEAKRTEARYLVQPMMVVRERAFFALDDSSPPPSEGDGENMGMGSL